MKNDYAQRLEFLEKNSPGYPTVEDLLKVTKYGNIAFEGDVRFEIEGSSLIEERILAQDDCPLYLLSWCGTKYDCSCVNVHS